MHSIDRRDFIGRLAAAVALPSALISREWRAPAGPTLVVTHCRHLEEVMDRSRDGMDMGVEEAQRAAAMFGGSVTSRFIPFGGNPIAGQPEPPPPPIDAVPGALQIVIPGVMAESLWRHTIASAKTAGAIVFNANSWTNEPYTSCERHVFHVRRSPRSLRTVRASTHGTSGTIELWSPTLTRFGADTLNKRFRSRGGNRMDSSAWAAWFAVKCAWEAMLQSKATTPAELIAQLEKSRFDGHKGVALYFDAHHELVQPLYAVQDGEVREEMAPMAGSTSAAQCR
jgi:hypothetical protein